MARHSNPSKAPPFMSTAPVALTEQPLESLFAEGGKATGILFLTPELAAVRTRIRLAADVGLDARVTNEDARRGRRPSLAPVGPRGVLCHTGIHAPVACVRRTGSQEHERCAKNTRRKEPRSKTHDESSILLPELPA